MEKHKSFKLTDNPENDPSHWANHKWAAYAILAVLILSILRISAIVDACFRLIVDGVSAPSWTRRGCAQARG